MRPTVLHLLRHNTVLSVCVEAASCVCQCLKVPALYMFLVWLAFVASFVQCVQSWQHMRATPGTRHNMGTSTSCLLLLSGTTCAVLSTW